MDSETKTDHKQLEINTDILDYWKLGTFIVLMTFIFIISAFVWILYNHSTETTYFLNLIQSNLTLISLSSIGALVGFVFAYFYLLFYIEQHHAFIFLESTKEAKTGTSVYMVYRAIQYALPFLLIYLIFVDKDWISSAILLILYLLTALVFKPIAEVFLRIIYNYKTLESLETRRYKGSLTNLKTMAITNVHEGITKIKTRNLDHKSLKERLEPYKEFLPILLNVTVSELIVKKSKFHLKNSIMILTLMFVFIALPAHINILVVAYAILTLIWWYWTIGVAFIGFPDNKFDVYLKSGKVYKDLYKVETSPDGYYEYLNKNNEVINAKRDEIEKEITVKE